MNEPKPNPSGKPPTPLPNLEARAAAMRAQEVLEICMRVRSQLGVYYQQIIWSVIERDRMTREQIAEAMGVTARAMRNWTQGQSAPRIQDQAVLLALDTGMLVIKLVPGRSGASQPTLVPGSLAGTQTPSPASTTTSIISSVVSSIVNSAVK